MLATLGLIYLIGVVVVAAALAVLFGMVDRADNCGPGESLESVSKDPRRCLGAAFAWPLVLLYFVSFFLMDLYLTRHVA
jgi:hypothetical protein